MRLRVLDLFSGIGGFSLGLERAGMTTVGFCEMDGYANAVLRERFPGTPIHPDVTTYDFKEGEADVITAGFPCQDISLAGDGAGLAGSRSGLYRHVIRAIRMVRPRFTILENVAALLGRGMGTVLGDLAEIGNDAEWHCIPASAVGAPHRRDRVWIIAHPGGEQHEGSRPPLSGSLAAQLPEAYLANTPRIMLDGSGRAGTEGWIEPANGGGDVANPDSPRLEVLLTGEAGQLPASIGEGAWCTEPDVGRVAYGVPSRVDRLRCLGNAVVPQIPEMIGRAILAVERIGAIPVLEAAE